MTDTTPIVRVATPEDEASIVTLLATGLMEEDGSGFRDYLGQPYPVDNEVLGQTVRFVLSSEQRLARCGVVDVDGSLAASIALAIMTPWYSRRRYLGDVWVYVAPDYRGGPCHSMLVEFAERTADRLQLDLVMGNFSESRSASKDRLLGRILKAKRYGSTFILHYNPTSVADTAANGL